MANYKERLERLKEKEGTNRFSEREFDDNQNYYIKKNGKTIDNVSGFKYAEQKVMEYEIKDMKNNNWEKNSYVIEDEQGTKYYTGYRDIPPFMK